jgi:AcrR family transcriptional regulator
MAEVGCAVARKDGGSEGKRRLAPAERQWQILEGAIDVFAEHGFGADTRMLAAHLGVSHSLIFRYFGSKEALIERVYEHVFVTRWNPDWVHTLRDRDRPIADRIVDFYTSYLRVVDDPRWIRIAMHASLDGRDLTRRYVNHHAAHLLSVVAAELHAAAGAPDQQAPDDIETAWMLHSTIIYYLVRKHIHRTHVVSDLTLALRGLVQVFLEGALPTLRHEARAAAAPTRRAAASR